MAGESGIGCEAKRPSAWGFQPHGLEAPRDEENRNLIGGGKHDMDLMSDDAIGAFGLLVAEAAERLVDSHDGSLDKRAAMLTVESPTFSREGRGCSLHSRSREIASNRSPRRSRSRRRRSDQQDEDFDFSPLSVALVAKPGVQRATSFQRAIAASTRWRFHGGCRSNLGDGRSAICSSFLANWKSIRWLPVASWSTRCWS